MDVYSFLDSFCDQLKVLVKHDYIAQKQSNYLKELKEGGDQKVGQLADNEVIALCDFSENLAFEIQDSAQSYYYAKTQCTIHPICIYYKEDGVLKQKSNIIIAESLKHTVEAVYLFQTKLIEYLKTFFGNNFNDKKIKFFSDGAASQYKNKKNFLNLCLFKKDFGIEAEWHFFATSHGKSPCDALGGTFKRNARNHNMKSPTSGVTNAKNLFEWAKSKKDSAVHFVYCTEKEYDDMFEKLNSQRYNKKISTVVGTQTYHCFKPIDESKISASTLSDSIDHKIFKLLR